MDTDKLSRELKSDLTSLDIPTDFNLVLKEYSKRYNGRYNPNKKEVILYLYENKMCTRIRKYSNILRTVIHESVHHYLWEHDSTFVRVKGVMHPIKFVQLESRWLKEAENLGMFRREVKF